MRTFLFITGIGIFAFSLVLLVGNMFYPPSLKYIEPLLCPINTTIGTKTISQNSKTSTYVVCRNGQSGKTIDVSGSYLLIDFSLSAIGSLLLIIRSRFKSVPKKEDGFFSVDAAT